jgi:hypothetical protein
MKKEVSPLLAIAALVVILGIGIFVYLRSERRVPVAGNAATPNGIPPQVNAGDTKTYAGSESKKAIGGLFVEGGVADGAAPPLRRFCPTLGTDDEVRSIS